MPDNRPQSTTDKPVVHRVSFRRNTVTGLWASRCEGCGWFLVGDEHEVKRRAAGHDLEWIDEPPGQFEVGAALRDEREQFRNGAFNPLDHEQTK